MLDTARTVRKIGQGHGWSWVFQRAFLELQWRSGWNKLRFPMREWAEDELARWVRPGIPTSAEGYAAYWRDNRQPYFFDSGQREIYRQALHKLLGPDGIQQLTEEANQITVGHFKYFSHRYGELGTPPTWNVNPLTQQATSPTTHWSEIPMFSKATGDLKYIWEPARFEIAYTLSRAYWATSDERYVEAFWQIVESFYAANPPNHGAHWRCGQETSLRLMALCFALYAFAQSPATTPQRLTMLAGMIAAQADRVAKWHAYAHLQRNNHAISEGVGVWLVGLLFPEFEQAQAWRELGRQVLTYEAEHQIGVDGSYIQNSFNYHRVMMQDYIYALRLGEVLGDRLEPVIYERLGSACSFMYQVQDLQTGNVPFYGADDGALITPMNSCGYHDFRPVLDPAYYLLNHRRLYPGDEPFEEDLLWLFGTDALEAPVNAVEQTSFAATSGGYYTLRGKHSFGLTRATTYQYRPAQADMLALDLWWRHQNVLIDPGSYSYFEEPPWNNSLSATAVHNTVTIDDQDQMKRGPRFIWEDWTRSEVVEHTRSELGAIGVFEGLHRGYERLEQSVTHHRAVIRVGDDCWIVVDVLRGAGDHKVGWQWLMPPDEFVYDEAQRRFKLALPNGTMALDWVTEGLSPVEWDTSVGQNADAPRGWRARYYGDYEPALSLRFAGRGQMPCRMISVFTFQAAADDASSVRFGEENVIVERTGEQIEVVLQPLAVADAPLIQSVGLTGRADEKLIVATTPRVG